MSGGSWVASARHEARYVFRSLSGRVYRRYFLSQAVSNAGRWTQAVAQSWLVYELTGSGNALGLTIALQFLPLLLLGPLGGVWVERVDQRRLLVLTQSALVLQALVLGLLTMTGLVELWMVYAMAFWFGLISAIDMPLRNVVIYSMVETELLSNAIGVNLVMINVARVFGPMIAGATITLIGIGPCFLVNAASFLPVFVVILMLRPGDLRAMPRAPRERGQVRGAFRYVFHRRELLGPLVMLFLFGAFTWQLEVSLPLFTTDAFDGGAAMYGALSSAVGVGSVVGGLLAARRPEPVDRDHLAAALLISVSMVLSALAPTVWIAWILLGVAGGAVIAWFALITAQYQLNADESMQGRAMALWTTALHGSRPIGGPVIGWIGEMWGGRLSVAVGGVTMLLLAVPAWSRITGHHVLSVLRRPDQGAEHVAEHVVEEAAVQDAAGLGA